jgi:hypothetical protein
VNVTITQINDAVAVDDTKSTVENTALTFAASDLLANDSDADGDPLTVIFVGAADHGRVALNAGQITYTPALNYHGSDRFSYTIDDGNGGTANATVNVTITPINDPVAVDDSKSTAENAVLTFAASDLLANDSDADGDPLTVISVGEASHGTVLLNAGQITYTPNLNYHGTDTFSYTISDDNGGTASATVHMTVTPINDAVARDDSRSTPEDTALTFAATDLLANDSDTDGDALTVISVGEANHGTVTLVAGQITYTPALNYHGTDSFSYTISDGNGGTATATVGVTIAQINDAAAANDTRSTAEDAALTFAASDLLANDSDADGDPLTVISVGEASHGTVVLNAGQITYTPALNYHGSDRFSYTISDGNGGTASATVDVTVTQINDAVAVDDTRSTAENAALTFAASDLLANDSDADGDPLSVISVGAAGNGTVTLNAGQITYTPNLNYHGTDTFTYTISDGNGGTASATVHMTITQINDAVAVDGTRSTAENAVLTFPASDLLANDSDADGDPLTVISVGEAGHGTVTLVDGQIAYTPTPNYHGSDRFSYTISDGHGGTASATVDVTIAQINDAVAVDDTRSTPEGGALSFPASDLLANDSDADGDPLTVISVGSAGHGTVALLDGQITYTPTPNYHGTDSFSYTISDGNGGTASAAVHVTITQINDAVAVDNTRSTAENTALTFPASDLLASDSDADGDPLTVISVGAAGHGKVTLLDGQITYTPAQSYSGTDAFSYMISDGHGGTASAMVHVVVTAVNDPPVAPSQAAPSTTGLVLSTSTASEQEPVTLTVTIASMGNGTPSGTVSFMEGTTLLGTAPVNDAGQATLILTNLPVGPHIINAVYSGDGNHMPSTSQVANLLITPAPTVAEGPSAASIQGHGPTVKGVKRYGFHEQATYLVLSFSGSLDAASAQSVSNYTVVGPVNRHGKGGKDVAVRWAVYNPAENSVMLAFTGRLNVHRHYRLTVNGTTASGICNPSGAMLNAEKAGQPGSDYVTTIAFKNLAGRVSQVQVSGMPTLIDINVGHAIHATRSHGKHTPDRPKNR